MKDFTRVKVSVEDLQIGMYVSELDRPWMDTDFLVQGFLIKTWEDIGHLKECCEYVYIDEIEKYTDYHYEYHSRLEKKEEPGKHELFQLEDRVPLQTLFPRRALKTYHDKASWEQEYPQAKKVFHDISVSIKHVLVDYVKGGSLEVEKINKAIDPMVESITRNPDACLWLARMKHRDKYTFEHSLGSSVWAVTLGRQIGLPQKDLTSLAIGSLLCDVGKLHLNRKLLQSTRQFNDKEFAYIKKHVHVGVKVLKESGIHNKDVLSMVAYHHERHNGQGYPEGLKGNDIPVFARIAAIVDCYDAITSQRSYANAVPADMAVKMLYQWRNIDFQAELVDEFIQAIGIYPAGTLVELSSGEVAVVVAEYRTHRLKPRVLVLLDENKQALIEPCEMELMQVTTCKDGRPMQILHSLPQDAYDLDVFGIEF